MQHFHPLGFGVAYRRKDDRLNRTQYYTVVAELTLGPLSIPPQRDALDGEFRGSCYRKLFKSTLNNRLHRNLACVIDKRSRGAKSERAFEELP